ncbi:putative late blight resistance protein homolog R1B-12 isoform X1 [Nicotiana tabacum]|uniref:Late blight resistance protein homolog R1B-12 isoform X1 n=1 Tax=Nicotiana tabacum TaxID=4097 RepID=A0AC58TFQ1_TOBAC
MTTTSEAVMGFEDETAELIQRLVRGPKQLDVVSLVGMPGIGKTTLAKRLYTHNDIIDRFDVCSWCTISQVYNKRKTLLELLGNLVPPNDNTRSNDELAVELRRHLLRKKYFIVIDDLWSAEVWDDLKSCFPDDYSCSRIILTTRQDKVASYTEVFSAPHHVRLFTGEESWCLLQKKVFGEESCAPQLEKIGVKIAQSCGGLPLAIILVAGVLAKLNKEEIRWEEVANGLSSCAAGDTQMYMDIIELSFRFLPSQLKRCFLYFGGFCEDELLVRKLIQLWVAEEYAVGNELKSAEDEAKGYVMELIDNNLVMVVQRSFFGEVRAIRMHDLLREFCFSKIDFPRSFLTRSDDSSSGDSPYYLQMNYLLHPERGSDSLRSGSPPGPHSAHLLPSDNILNQNIILVYDCNHLSHDDYYKSLRILDLSCITLRSTSPIQALINLRYLALKGNFEADPSWLSELKSLETVILNESRRLNLSHAIWGMVSLKHLEVTGKPAVIRCNVAEFETYPPLEKLQWLSFALLPGGEEFQQFVSKVPNLVKLRCLVEEPQGDRTCIWLPGLESLNKLESLKVYFLKRSVRRFEVNFPMNLKKLTLSSCQLPWSEISIIGNLENLEVLKLESNAFEGEQWDVKDEEFQNLKLLTFYNMNVPSWNFSDMSFPNLQRVIFKNSRLKTNIPRSFGDLLLLQMIELSWCKCSRRTINSAEEIKKAQIDDMGNHEFKLIIKSREEDEELRLMWQVDSDLRNWKFHFCFLLLLFLIISNIFSSF